MKQILSVAASVLVSLNSSTAAPILYKPHVLVSSTSGSISRVDAATGQYIDQLISGLSLSGGAPMTVGPDGNLYVGSFARNVIHKINTRTGAYYGVFATGATGVRGIEFGPNGNLFVAAASGSAVKEYNGTTGAFIRDAVSVDTPIDIKFGANNILYVARGHHQLSTPSSIVQYNSATGALLRTFASSQVDTPQALLLGPDGDVFVSNQWDGAEPLVKFDGITGAVKFTATGLDNPQGLLLLPNHTLLIATSNDFINRYDGDTGAFVGTFISTIQLGTTSDLLYVVPEVSTAVLSVSAVAAVFIVSARRALSVLYDKQEQKDVPHS